MSLSLKEFFERHSNGASTQWNASLNKHKLGQCQLLQLFYDDMVGPSHAARRLQSKYRYVDWLHDFHNAHAPKVYLEIGINEGRSLRLAQNSTLAVGVDPVPRIKDPIFRKPPFRIKAGTSDSFFIDAAAILQGQKVDLSFIDGLHIFEYVLRDFIGCEALSKSGGVIALHDVLPQTPAYASRLRFTSQWTGDVWRLMYVLKEFRPDLQIKIFTLPPTGLAVITNLDPESTLLRDQYDEVVAYGLKISCVDHLKTRDTQFLFADFQLNSELV